MTHRFTIFTVFLMSLSVFVLPTLGQESPSLKPAISEQKGAEKVQKQPEFLYAKKYDGKIKDIQQSMDAGVLAKKHPKQKKLLQEIPDLTIIIEFDGVIWKVEDEEYKLTIEAYKKKLTVVSKVLGDSKKVTLQASPYMPFEKVKKVLDLTQGAGFMSVAFKVDRTDQEPASEETKVENMNHFCVGGHVKNPNVFDYRKEIKLYDAICFAGGASDFGDIKRVKLIRGGKSFIYNLRKDAVKIMRIYPGDMIEVLQKRWDLK